MAIFFTKNLKTPLLFILIPLLISCNKNNALLKASFEGDDQQVSNLLGETGVEIDTRDNNQNTPLILAASEGHIEIVKVLLEKGADINAVEHGGNTSLLFAISQNHHDIVKILLSKNADVNIPNSEGETALLSAVSLENTEIVKLIIKNGADLNYSTVDRLSAVYLAGYLQNNELLEIIEKAIKEKDHVNTEIIPLIKAEQLAYTEDELVFHEGDAPWNENFERIGEPIAMGKTLQSKNDIYHIKKIMDYDIATAWVEGEEGQGIGSEFGFKIQYVPNVLPQTVFKGNCYIINGYYKTEKTWSTNSRVKKLQAYINNKPLALIELNDFRGIQVFNLAPFYKRIENEPTKEHLPLLKVNDILSFKILEVYPGTKYEDTSISEFFTDGVMY